MLKHRARMYLFLAFSFLFVSLSYTQQPASQSPATSDVLTNNDVLKMADWIIDLGPEGGDAGGYVVTAGPPETVAKHPLSHTGKYLAPYLQST